MKTELFSEEGLRHLESIIGLIKNGSESKAETFEIGCNLTNFFQLLIEIDRDIEDENENTRSRNY